MSFSDKATFNLEHVLLFDFIKTPLKYHINSLFFEEEPDKTKLIVVDIPTYFSCPDGSHKRNKTLQQNSI